MGHAFDVFISHASEDKVSVARPLARRLASAGLRVWLDEFELTIGDSLRRKIDDGLSRSAFGIVVLSPSFFVKEWPNKELDGLVAREQSGVKVIIPVWHDIDHARVAAYSPILADRLAASTSTGIDKVAEQIIRAVRAGPHRAAGPEIANLPAVRQQRTQHPKIRNTLLMALVVCLLAPLTYLSVRVWLSPLPAEVGGQGTAQADISFARPPSLPLSTQYRSGKAAYTQLVGMGQKCKLPREVDIPLAPHPIVFGSVWDKTNETQSPSFSLAPDQRKQIKEVIAWLFEFRGRLCGVLVLGNVDVHGSREYNLALGQKLAEVVARELSLQGVAAESLEVLSLGKENVSEAFTVVAGRNYSRSANNFVDVAAVLWGDR